MQRVRETRSLNSQDIIELFPKDGLPPPPQLEIPYPIFSGSDSKRLGRKSKRDSLRDSNFECYRSPRRGHGRKSKRDLVSEYNRPLRRGCGRKSKRD